MSKSAAPGTTRRGMHNAKCILQIGPKGSMAFDSIAIAAEEAGVGKDTLATWVGDGMEHHGFRWEWELKSSG